MVTVVMVVIVGLRTDLAYTGYSGNGSKSGNRQCLVHDRHWLQWQTVVIRLVLDSIGSSDRPSRLQR